MLSLLRVERAVLSPLFVLASVLSPGAAHAQTDTTAGLEPPTAAAVALSATLYTAQANVRQAGDSSVIRLANDVLFQRLQDLLGDQLVERARATAIATSPEARDTAGGQTCSVIVACARFVGAALHAPWVVMVKISKTSNLIWLLTGQLIHVPTGKIVLDDSTELKGDPEVMVRAGTRIFAERVARTVRDGGVTSNFPNAR
jgi:hypothetical protein